MQTGAGDIFSSVNSGGANQMKNPVFSDTTWGGAGGGVSPGGSNQWMSYPALPNFNPGNPSSPTAYHLDNPLIGGKHELGGGMATSPTMSPTFTNDFYQMLQSFMGEGGNLQHQLLSFLGGTPSNIPGSASLTGMAQTGDPISALPEWQKMIEAQQRGIGENAANLKEQFAFMGNLAGSPMATGMSDYFSQTSKDQNALLAQLEQQSMESAMQRKLAASQDITGMAGAESQFLNQLFQGSALASPNLYNAHKGSGILGGIGSLLGGLGSFGQAASDAGGLGDFFKSIFIGGK